MVIKGLNLLLSHIFIYLCIIFHNLTIWFQFTRWSWAFTRRQATQQMDQMDIFLKWQALRMVGFATTEMDDEISGSNMYKSWRLS